MKLLRSSGPLRSSVHGRQSDVVRFLGSEALARSSSPLVPARGKKESVTRRETSTLCDL